MPSELLYRVTSKCNKHCTYCFNEVYGYDLSGSEIRLNDSCCKTLKELGIKRIYLSGGEPAMREDVVDIMQLLYSVADLIMFTNGYLFERFTINELLSFPLSGINVSLEPTDICGQYSNRIIVERLRNYAIVKNRAKITILTFIRKDTIHLLQEFMSSEVVSFADRVCFQPLVVPDNHILYPFTLPALSKKDADFIFTELKQYVSGEDIEHLRIIQYFNNMNNVLPYCLMGREYLTVNPDLTLGICPHRPDISLGKLMDLNAFTIIKHTKALRRNGLGNFNCRSMRCVCLYSHLYRRYGSAKKNANGLRLPQSDL